MPSALLREHDAQQGAQSKGEFLGMTGNSSWWLLGSAGLSVFMMLVLWGVFGMPFLLCLVAGLGLCALALLYVFLLKNDKPAHYDTDFFESVLIEAGAVELTFGPRVRRPESPFQGGAGRNQTLGGPAIRFGREAAGHRATAPGPVATAKPALLPAELEEKDRKSGGSAVPLPAFERLQEELSETQENLQEALMEREEDSYAL